MKREHIKKAAINMVAKSGLINLSRKGLCNAVADPGGGTEPEDVVVSIYIQWTDEVQEEGSETWNGNFT